MDGGCCWDYRGNPSPGLPFLALGYPGAEPGVPWGILDSSGPPPCEAQGPSPSQLPLTPHLRPCKRFPEGRMEAGGAGWGEQGGEGAPPHLPSRVWVSAGCHRPPGQPVPSTGQGRGGGGEGAFLGCLGAESPPATAATRTRRDTPRPHRHTHSVCAEQSTRGHTRVAGYGHTQRRECADPRSAAAGVPCGGTCSDTRSFGHADTQHPPSVCAHTCARTYGFGGGAGTCPSQPPPAQHSQGLSILQL